MSTDSVNMEISDFFKKFNKSGHFCFHNTQPFVTRPASQIKASVPPQIPARVPLAMKDVGVQRRATQAATDKTAPTPANVKTTGGVTPCLGRVPVGLDGLEIHATGTAERAAMGLAVGLSASAGMTPALATLRRGCATVTMVGWEHCVIALALLVATVQVHIV